MSKSEQAAAMKDHSWVSRFVTSLLLVTVLLLGATQSSQATQAGKPQVRNEPPQQTVQSVVAKQASLVSEFEVNGLKVLMKRREGSLTVSAGLFVRGGAANINASNAGIESLMLSASTEATTGFPREKMRSELSRMGTVIGSSATNDYSVLSLACTRMHFDRSWQLFTDVILRPSFTKEDVSLVQDRAVVALSDDTDNPDVYLQKLQEKVAYAGHPYLNDTDGTPETIAKLTPEDLRRYHDKLMETSHLLLVIVGDLDPAEVRDLVTASIGKLPRGNYKPEPMPTLTFDKSTVEITPRALPTNYVQGFFTAPSLTSPDIYAMRVASSLLRDRVFEEVRVKRNLSYAPDAFLRNQAANVGGLYVTAVDANQSVRLMLNEISKLQQQAVRADEIQAVVAQYLTTYYMGQETNAAQAGELAQYELIGGGWRTSTDFLEKLTAVTPTDVQRVAQKYMRNIRFVVLGNPQSVDTGAFMGQAE
ncbi:MAG TPA: pitrilysin family protein [Pyrinomonadaceae bacterium]|jgi:Predicted Zn-dependent peptidases|nr:pitrilysin family protein [Pyrinomonadaceae bacterium]